MPLDFLIDRLDGLPATSELAEALPDPGVRQGIAGLPGSSPAVLLAALARRLAQRVFVLIAPTPTDAERWLADLATLLGSAVALYPQREALGAEEPHVEIAGERVETLELLLSGRSRVLVTTARAAAERTGVPSALRDMRVSLSAGERGAVRSARSRGDSRRWAMRGSRP
jgi:transcription-repair coupling factor (superfamily II helicase)